MKKKVLLAIVASVSLALFSAYSQKKVSQSGTTTLTVTEVVVEISPFSVKTLKMSDEKGKEISWNCGNEDKFFENATIQGVTMPKGTNVQAAKDGDRYYMVIANDSKLRFEFKVNGKIYPIGVGVGSKFAVRKTANGNYNLLPEETTKLSPPPAEEKVSIQQKQ